MATFTQDLVLGKQVVWAQTQKIVSQLCNTCIHADMGFPCSVEGETMILGKLTLAMLFLTAPAVWAQFNRADMMKVATDRPRRPLRP